MLVRAREYGRVNLINFIIELPSGFVYFTVEAGPEIIMQFVVGGAGLQFVGHPVYLYLKKKPGGTKKSRICQFVRSKVHRLEKGIQKRRQLIKGPLIKIQSP